MAEEASSDGQVPPAGEAIHLPDPSYLPVIVAAGTTLALVGVVLNLVLAALGTVIAVVAIVRWVRQTRAEMAELPLDHGH
ncbi:MAG TPA: hypothetical protein VGV10_06995 [Thermoleophilaceae bacterium]|nr:hypothetical protein [Thermoleophilaceae bacterium]